jgi:hypothetical protein
MFRLRKPPTVSNQQQTRKLEVLRLHKTTGIRGLLDWPPWWAMEHSIIYRSIRARDRALRHGLADNIPLYQKGH